MTSSFLERLQALGFSPALESAEEARGCVFAFEGAPRLEMPANLPRFDLRSPLEDQPAAMSLDFVLLECAAEHLSLVELRRFLHRGSRLLRPEGLLLWSDRDPEAAERQGLWPGEELPDGGRHRSLRQHLELLRLYPLRVLTPCSGPEADRLIFGALRMPAAEAFSYNPTRAEEIPREDRAAHAETRYGAGSLYRRFDRLGEPEIVDDLLFALSRMRLKEGHRLLAIGCNDGRELELVAEAASGAVEGWGLDLSASAIEAARRRFPDFAERFLAADASRLDELDLPEFHAVLILNTLQCRTLDRDRLLRGVLKRLRPRASVLVSIPNCHHGAFDILRRPLDRNDPRHDRSVVHKEMRYLTRFFHRARFDQVDCFGSYDAFLLARRSR